MASFSPSPAPRRVQRLRRHTSRLESQLGSPPPQEASSSIQDDESVASRMDVDEELYERTSRTDLVFAKSKELVITYYAQLPAEVRQALRSADFNRDAYSGDVDPLTGFALVASAETCFVWNYNQALTGTPTCYIFVCPQDVDPTAMATPLHALVPYGSSREPGLVLISPSGNVRFWDNIGMGLAGGDNGLSLSLNLNDSEIVTTLTRSDPLTYIVSTSEGRLTRLVVTSTGGKFHLAAHVFSRPTSSLSLSRLLPSFWTLPSLQPQAGNVNAVALGDAYPDASGRDLWALVGTRIQRWNLSVEGWEELLLEEDISVMTCSVIRRNSTSAPADDLDLELELLDIKVESSTTLLILLSYAGHEDESDMIMENSPPRRIYCIIRVKRTVDTFHISSFTTVPYQSTSSSRAPMHPRLQLVQHGQLIVVQFGDAVTLGSTVNKYMDRLELKSSQDRTLGVGVLENGTDFLVLTAATMMKACIDMDEVANFDPEVGRASLIKSTMVQAILYGSYPENPLQFSFPPEIDEDALMAGAEQLSGAVLESDPEIVRPNHDLHAQLTTRKDRLSFLVGFINDNAVLTKMTQGIRQRLATDAEKLYAAHQVWRKHEEWIMSRHRHNVLYDAVFTYMHDMKENYHEDCLRAFFRLKVAYLGNLITRVVDVVRRSSREHVQDYAEILIQATEIAMIILDSALSYRQYNAGVYGVELPMIDPWSSQPDVIEHLGYLFDVTEILVQSPSEDADTNGVLEAVKAQLPKLASILIGSVRERLDWLESPLVEQSTNAQRERAELNQHFNQMRPRVFETLRRLNFAEEAFRLAETYRDFRSLASLCNKDTVYPPNANPYASRIQSYIERFKEAFTAELYQWYIEHGELRTMFTQEHDAYLDGFFTQHSHPEISWIYSMAHKKYGQASESLLTEADNATELASKHLMLSIGKLSHLAQLQENSEDINQSTLDAFHDGLDFISVHEALIQNLKTALISIRARQSLEKQVDTIGTRKASKLAGYPGLQHVFRLLVRRLLLGKALSIEDVAELLSLKDNEPEIEDYATALHLLAKAKKLPNSRRLSTFRRIWRRIYLHDDWHTIRQTAGVTDAELNERLRSTALYAALQATLTRQDQPEGYILKPAAATIIPEHSEIAVRWSGLSPDEVDAVERDCAQESTILNNLELDDVFESMRQLVTEDQQQWMEDA
ncbi:hypothetical protein CERSUDRAFT_113529 [Gelatoporia subvermispora B]|uniref:Nucleoporin Nup133/Nup155-like C-terminal domain-containing protein n=1 Tax=Ceriporiopsis subvermispora (strain B) TaxID=914234 RepID=M2R1H1_CERS8|nr:hypothetical protein CERSUDRAFT_113529 [Gelatoporia subvermispora B]